MTTTTLERYYADMMKRVLVLNKPINDATRVQTVDEIPLCYRDVGARDIIVHAFAFDPVPDKNMLVNPGWAYAIYEPDRYALDGSRTRLSEIVTVVYDHRGSLYDRWFAVKVPILRVTHHYSERIHAHKLIRMARLESKAGVGLVAKTERWAKIFVESVFFQDEADAVHFSMMVDGLKDGIPVEP